MLPCQLFIHWGLYSLLGGVWQERQVPGYSEQIMAHASIPPAEYEQLATRFNPVAWDPAGLARLVRESGMTGLVITAKHHDGFCLFHSRHTTYNVVDATPYGRNLLLELANACRAEQVEFGIYFSTIDWHYPGGTGIDRAPDGTVRNDNLIPEAHAEFNVAQLKELLSGYGPISQVWFDMGHPTPAQSARFHDVVKELQPAALVSGRVFNHCGDFDVMGDNEIPAFPLDRPWQCPVSMFNETWGYRSWQERGSVEQKIHEHLSNLIGVVCRGGSFLINIGPRGDGSLVEFEVEVLQRMGRWLDQHAHLLENADPQPFRDLPWGFANVQNRRMNLFVTRWPANGLLELPGLGSVPVATTLEGERLPVSDWNAEPEAIRIRRMPSAEITALQLEFSEKPMIRQLAHEPDSDGTLRLTPDNADRFMQMNGEGYYDPPTVSRMRWSIADPQERIWKVEATVLSTDPPEVTIRWQNQLLCLNPSRQGNSDLWSAGGQSVQLSRSAQPFDHPTQKGVELLRLELTAAPATTVVCDSPSQHTACGESPIYPTPP